MRGGGAGGGLDLGVCGVRASEADVLSRRGGEDHRVLRHQRQMPPELRPRHLGQGQAVQRDAPRGRIVEPQQQLQHRGLARARRADQRDRLAGLDGEADPVQRRDRRARRIAKGHVIEGDPPAHRRPGGARGGRIAHLVLGLQQLHQPLRRAGRALDLAPDLRERRDPAGDHHRVDQELRQLADRHPARGDVARADPQHPDDPCEDEEDHDHRHHRARADPLARAVVGPLGQVAEASAHAPLGGEGLHRLHRQQRL